MSEIAGLPIVRRGALAAAALVAFVLLLVFHSVVAGAVQRAAQRRNEAMTATVSQQTPPVARTVRRPYVPTRKVALARAD
jgi:hypothetical protein